MSQYKIIDQGPVLKNVNGETKKAYKYRIQTPKGILILFSPTGEMAPDEIDDYVERAMRNKR